MKVCFGYNKPMDDVGFKSVDIQGNPNIMDDVFELKSIKDNSCDIIIASHVLEHGNYNGVVSERRDQLVEVLKLWYSKLKEGGILYLAVPNFDFVAVYYIQHRNTFWQDIDTDIAGPLFGGGSSDSDQHKMIFNQPFLTHVMQTAGFVDIQEMAIASAVFLPKFKRASTDCRGFNMMGVKRV